VHLLEVREAGFADRGETIVGPVTLSVDDGERAAYPCSSDRSAGVLALMAAGLVKPTFGRVFIGAFDPRIQPVQAKRLTGYVPYETVQREFASFTRYVEYRAALAGIPRAQAVVRARGLLERLEGVHPAFAHPLVGALLAHPRLLVLDRPQAVYARHIERAAEGCAVFSTHASARDARRFLDERTAV
jgi:ABC-2 type transport system ATP-binding protein